MSMITGTCTKSGCQNMLDLHKGLTAGQPFFLCLVEFVGSFIYIIKDLNQI